VPAKFVLAGIEPTHSGSITRSSQRIHWQEFGAGDDTVLLLPTWSIVHSDFWRHQVPFLSRHYRVVTFDGLGNGASDRPTDPQLYGDLLFAEDAAAVMDATATERAAVLGVSAGAGWALALAARYPKRVAAAIFIAASVPLAPGHPERVAAAAEFDLTRQSYAGWQKWNRNYWLSNFPDFLRFFFSKCFTEPDSSEQIEHFVGMGMQTTGEILLATGGTDAQNLTRELAMHYAGSLQCPSLVIHGTDDAISPLTRATELARLTRAKLETLKGVGHEPQCRFPAQINEMIAGFLSTAFDVPA
jgi:pimeloyl-ACP methyl ester carboxylesterase